jgi:hypothetical protein
MTMVAEWTGLEPATPGVTGRYSNQLNYHSAVVLIFKLLLPAIPSFGCLTSMNWYALGDSNPCSHRERVVS